jgi:hypothetical protein
MSDCEGQPALAVLADRLRELHLGASHHDVYIRLGPMNAEYASLRAELKAWERDFLSEHGRKATPEDIRLVDGLGTSCNLWIYQMVT